MKFTDESFNRLTLVGVYTTYFLIRKQFAPHHTATNQEDELDQLSQSIINEGKYSVVLRTLLAPTLLIAPALYVIYPRWIAYFKIPLPSSLRFVATGVTLTSLPFLYWIHYHLGRFWSSDLEVKEDHHLVRTGLYQWIRHPMYTALLLFYTGTAFTSANWIVLVPNFVSIVVMLNRIEKEEEMLINKFGQDYLDYKEQTGSLLPRLFSF